MRQPQPYYRAAQKAWYVSIDRKQTLLGRGDNKKSVPPEVWAKYNALMANRLPTEPTTPVAMLIGRFLTWVEGHLSDGSYAWYQQHLTSFVEKIGGKLTLDKLKRHHVTEWLDERYADAGDTYKNGAVRALMRAFNWAEEEGHIPVNPIRKFKRPTATNRVVYIEVDQWAKLIAAVDESDPFYDLIMFLRETGCRPQEARAIEARHFDRMARQIVFPVKESKGKKVSRVIPLTDRSFAIIQRLALKHPGKEEHLFRNVDGKPWKKDAINCRFTRLTEKLGFKVFAYAIRHTFITDALILGIDPATLACIVGHRDATMILKVYGHVNLNKGHVRAAAERIANSKPEPKREAS